MPNEVHVTCMLHALHKMQTSVEKILAGTDNPTETAILKAPAINKMTFNKKKKK